MSAPLVSVDGVSKVYPRVHRPSERLHAFVSLLAGREPQQGAEVLSGVSFEVQPGESYGVIGENGAGKSTLLKVLTGVISPTQGTVRVNARTAALLELGAGFQPEFSGLDNVRMKAALLGLSPRELDARLDDILAFADIGEYIHEPVKHYSSGMVVRLGFAVVTAAQPELLITDEVLAVGDESFQKKCIAWIERFLQQGNSLLMVSHSMFLVQKLCQKALWLHAGKPRLQGDVFEVTQAYLAWHESRVESERRTREQLSGQAGQYRVASVQVLDAKGVACDAFDMGQAMTVELVVNSPDGRAPAGLIGLVRADGTAVYGVTSDFDGISPQPMANGKFRFVLEFPQLSLLPGRYSVRGHAMDPEGMRVFDTTEVHIVIRGRSRELGMVRIPHQWRSD